MGIHTHGVPPKQGSDLPNQRKSHEEGDDGIEQCGPWETPKYAALAPGKTIRLLTLHPGQDGEPLELSLSDSNLSEDQDALPFSALSYVWGDPEELLPAVCDGRTIGITKNLSDCLHSIRLTDAARLLWIDAICINQQDLEERSAQVGIMGEIYARAEKVLIWLGQGNDDTKLGVFALESMAKAWKPPPDQAVSFTTVLEFARASRIRHLHYWALGRQQYIRSVSDSPWFTRAWTFQEVGLSSDAEVWIGRHKLPFRTLVYAWLLSLHENFERTIFLNGYGRTTETGRTCMHAMFAYWYLQNHGTAEEVKQWCQLHRLLRLRQLHEATDPRDLIFSLLSLSHSDDADPFKADYRMPVEDVFAKFAAKAITESGDLSLLSECERHGSDSTLPSWVPDWKCPPTTNPLNSLLSSAWREYNASKDRPDAHNLDKIDISDGKTLRITATHIDTVKESHSLAFRMLQLPAEMRSLDWSETTKALWYFIRTRLERDYDSAYAPTNEPTIVALLRTLSADNFPTSPALKPDEAAHRFPLHYSLMRHPRWLTLRGHLLRKLRVWDYHVPETHGMKIGNSPDATKHAVRAASGPPPLLPYLPAFLRRVITGYSPSVGKSPYIGPIQRGNGSISPRALNNFYVDMLRTRMRRHWFSYVPYLTPWLREKAKVLYKTMGYGQLDLRRSELLLEIMANVEKATEGRKLIVTEKRYLGLGSLDVQPGDRVSLLGRSPVPYLLRPCENEAGTYKLVGECYVHGIMDGELWRAGSEKEDAMDFRGTGGSSLEVVEVDLV
ncbi:HET-domain-containing protein [Coniochaeta hoffmannii]|uniref:HET-domain-containing protein n=1 Tax=Coniochaeta hoffmannii TaxID=91930 RepID=A0AA38S8R7_9PEZI|nr:HET-domain-containing protein [Coniochaeta hoffmannii]